MALTKAPEELLDKSLTSALTITTADNNAQLILVSTDADASTGPQLDLTRSSASPAASDTLGRLRFVGKDSAGNDLSYGHMTYFIEDPTDGAEDGIFEIDVRSAGTNRSRLKMDSSETIFNNEQVNIDFRVESDSKSHMLFVDAGSDVVLVGTNTINPQSASSGGNEGCMFGSGLITAGRAGGEIAIFNRQSSDGDVVLIRKDGSTVGSIATEGGDMAIGNDDAGIQFVNGTEHFRPFSMASNAATDALMDIGSSSKRFKDSYISGTANVGTQVKFPSASYDDRSIGLDSGGFYLYNNGDSRYDFHVDENGALKAVGSYGSKINASDSYHELSVGGGGSGLAVYIFNNNTSGSAILANANGNVGNSNCYLFRGYSGSASQDNFYIYSNGSTDSRTGTYGTMSDVKLKQDIEDASSQWDDVKAFRFRKYRLKSEVEADPNTGYHLGVIAQELELTSPNLVTENPDLDDKNNDLGTTTKAVKTSILLMKTAKALQEAMERIETLEAEVATLKGE